MPFLTCNRQIDSVDRRQCNLQHIPGDLERYARSLEELLLDMNHIRDLPKSLFRLQKLQRLGLSDNDIHRLPPDVSALQNLIELNLSRNDISDLPEDLKVCHNLQILDISSNPIARLPDSITLCTSLTQLSLNDISLTKLPLDIGKLVLLRSLEVRENHLHTLPPSIAELTQLQRLDLGQNELDELPTEIGNLRSLQELYVDENSLESIPDAIIQCNRLEQLDASSNRLFQLPEELGDITSLADLIISHNCLRELPNSIGRLKHLTSLKADDNTLDSLTPAIGGCVALNELYLQQNLILELPSSIGNLRCLQTLNLDRCQLRRLPALIGECLSLTVFSIRDNQLDELPMEIGKLAKLRVLDVCNNRLVNLPYTINVLRELQALWISENQSQALLRLQQDIDPRTGIKVLTCYLLPQKSADVPTTSNNNGSGQQQQGTNKAAFLGGPKVHFDHTEHQEEPSNLTKTQFERKNTPHPKPGLGTSVAVTSGSNAAKHHKKQQMDGHVMPRMEEHPKQIVLSGSVKKISQDHSNMESSSSIKEQQQNLPRSALKYSSRDIIQQQHKQMVQSVLSTSNELSAAQRLEKQAASSQQKQQKTVFFEDQMQSTSAAADSPIVCRLKRVNTPHYKSQQRTAAATATKTGQSNKHDQSSSALQSLPTGANRRQLPNDANAPNTSSSKAQRQNDGMHIQSSQHQQQSGSSNNIFAINSNINNNNQQSTSGGSSDNTRPKSPQTMERKRIILRRTDAAGGGLGLSIAGGIESTPFVDDDPGLFISKLVPGGTAERAGLRVGDKVLEINDTSMIGQRHQIAVECIHQRSDVVEFLIQRWNNKLTTVQQSENPPNARNAAIPEASASATITNTVPLPSINSSHSHSSISVPLFSSATSTLPPIAATASSTSTTPISFQQHRPTTPSQLTNNTSFTSLPIAVNNTITTTTTPKLPNAADLLYGDSQLDGVIEQVELVRDSKNSLGLSIVGGLDHCSHPFGSPSNRGVFISKITTNSPAELSRRLRIGDRILRVNDIDISNAMHNEAVEALKRTSRSLRLTICHESQPKGLRSVIIHRHEFQPLGLSICGGIGSKPVNLEDLTDEGIFIERIESDGPADQSCVGLTVGTRILEVNDDSLLGCTKEEAAQVFRRASSGPVRLLICEGFSTSANRPQTASITVEASTSSPITIKKISPIQQQQQQQNNNQPFSLIDGGVNLVNSPTPSLNEKQQNGDNNGSNSTNNEYQNLLGADTANVKQHKDGDNSNMELKLISTSTQLPIINNNFQSPHNVVTEATNHANQRVIASVSLPSEFNCIGSVGEQQRRQPSGGVTTFSTEPAGKQTAIEHHQNNERKTMTDNNVSLVGGPPLVAPKPKTNITCFSTKPSTVINCGNNNLQNDQNKNAVNSNNDNSSNNNTNFSSRLRQFQEQQSAQQPIASTQAQPSKRPLLSSDDLAKLAEDERMRQQLRKTTTENGNDAHGLPLVDGISPMSSPQGIVGDRQSSEQFEHLLNNSPIPFPQTVSSIRTKKAENRFLQQQQQQYTLNSAKPLFTPSIDQLAMEQKRRSEWRQARMASLEAESKRIGQLINDVNEISKLTMAEEQSQPAADQLQDHSIFNENASNNNSPLGVGILYADDEENVLKKS